MCKFWRKSYQPSWITLPKRFRRQERGALLFHQILRCYTTPVRGTKNCPFITSTPFSLLLKQFFNAAYKLDPIPSYSYGPFYTISCNKSRVVRISSVVVSWFSVRRTPLRWAWHKSNRSWNVIHCMPCKTPCMFVHPFKLPWSFRPSSSSVKCPYGIYSGWREILLTSHFFF